jgi:predicted PurR-regulated permease PerM
MMNRVVSFVALIGIVILVSALVFQVMASFLLPMFLAIVMVVVFRPMHQWIVAKCNGRNRLGSALTTAVIMIIVLAPLLTTTILAVADLYEVAARMDAASIEQGVDGFRDHFELNLPEEMRPIGRHVDQLTRVTRGIEPPDRWNAAVTELRNTFDAIENRLAGNAPGPAPPATDGAGTIVPSDDDLKGLISRLDSLEAIVEKENEAGELPLHDADERLQDFLRTYQLVRPRLIQRLNALDEKDNNDGAARAWLTAQANPSRQQLEDLRVGALEQLGMGALAITTGQYISGALGKLILGLFVMVISLYYFLADGPAMIEAVMSISPLEPRYGQQMLAEFVKISRAVVMAIVVAAVVQGALATIGYWVAGLNSLFLLCILTTLLAMIPFVGAASVWIPCSLYLAFSGRPFAGIVLALYGLLVVSMIDNLIKPMVLHGQSKLHPLLALLSIIGGVQALGPIGIFVGPMVVSFLQAVLNMFHAELKALGGDAPPEKPDGTDNPILPRRRRGRG